MLKEVLGAMRLGDLPKVLVATVSCLSIVLLTTGLPRTLFLSVVGVLLWIAEFLLLAELSLGLGSRGRWRFRRKPRDQSYLDNQVLRVMNEVMNVRPEPFSRRQ